LPWVTHGQKQSTTLSDQDLARIDQTLLGHFGTTYPSRAYVTVGSLVLAKIHLRVSGFSFGNSYILDIGGRPNVHIYYYSILVSLGMVDLTSFAPTWSILPFFLLCYGVGLCTLGSS